MPPTFDASYLGCMESGYALTLESVRGLASSHRPPCLSFYLPTHGGMREEDRARLEGLVRRAREILKKSLRPAEIEEVLGPLEELGKPETWREQQQGLAVFVAQSFHAAYRLPAEMPELFVAAESFHIRPLLRFVESNRHYFVLLLGKEHVGLFKGSAEGLVRVPVEGLPRSLEDALGSEDRERSLTYHFGARGGKPIFGGGGKNDTSRDEDDARFCRAVDERVWSVLREERAPLVLAASEREAALFRSLTRYRHVARETLGPDLIRATSAQIHEHAWPIVQAIGLASTDEVIDRYDRLFSRGRSLDEVRAIAKFALEGRVADLLLDRARNLWGRLDRATGDVALYGERRSDGDEDVLDDIAEAVLLRGGHVWSVEAAQMPTASPVAAVLRW